MPQLTFLQLAQKILEEERRALTAGELWEIAQLKGYDKAISTKGKRPWATLAAQIYVEVREG